MTKPFFSAEDFDSFNIRHINSATGKPIEIDGVSEVVEVCNAKVKEILSALREDLQCYSTGMSVLSEDKIKEWFE